MFKFILHYYSRQKKRLIIYVIGLSLSICASLISPQIVGFFIDGLIAKRNTDFLIHFVVTFLLLQISMMLTNYLLAIIGGIVRANVSITMNFETLFHLQKLSYTFFKDSDVIYLNQRINADSNAMSSFFLDNLTILFGSLITFSFSTVYIAKLKPGLLLILLGVMLLYFLFYYILRREIYRKGHEFKETQGKYFSMLSAQLTQIFPIKLYNLYNYFHNKLRKESSNLIKKLIAKQKIDFLGSNLDKLINILAQCCFFSMLGFAVINSEITVGQFTVINIYFSCLIGAMGSVSNFKQSYIDTRISYKRIKEFSELETESEGTYTLSNKQIQNITLNDFTFNYEKQPLFEDFSCTFSFGEITCITGKNGSGKTTLLMAILGLLRNKYTGSVLFNNIDINDVNMCLTRERLIGFAPQNPIIIPFASIMQNIFINNEKTEIDETNIASYPNLYEILDLKKANINLNDKLSGGEKQKISILRIIENDFNAIILDEPTNDLDQNSRSELMNYLQKNRRRKLTIIVTHDCGLLELSDKTICLGSC